MTVPPPGHCPPPGWPSTLRGPRPCPRGACRTCSRTQPVGRCPACHLRRGPRGARRGRPHTRPAGQCPARDFHRRPGSAHQPPVPPRGRPFLSPARLAPIHPPTLLIRSPQRPGRHARPAAGRCVPQAGTRLPGAAGRGTWRTTAGPARPVRHRGPLASPLMRRPPPGRPLGRLPRDGRSTAAPAGASGSIRSVRPGPVPLAQSTTWAAPAPSAPPLRRRSRRTAAASAWLRGLACAALAVPIVGVALASQVLRVNTPLCADGALARRKDSMGADVSMQSS